MSSFLSNNSNASDWHGLKIAKLQVGDLQKLQPEGQWRSGTLQQPAGQTLCAPESPASQIAELLLHRGGAPRSSQVCACTERTRPAVLWAQWHATDTRRSKDWMRFHVVFFSSCATCLGLPEGRGWNAVGRSVLGIRGREKIWGSSGCCRCAATVAHSLDKGSVPLATSWSRTFG